MHPGRKVTLPSGRECRVQIAYRQRSDKRMESLVILRVEEAGKWVQVGFGKSACSAKDNFCRRTGRKLAMERALKLAEQSIFEPKFSRDDRRALWAVIVPYRSSKKKSVKKPMAPADKG